ncbi:MAG: hypothetical protein AAFW73_24330 [Bacteroidota bacterium]
MKKRSWFYLFFGLGLLAFGIDQYIYRGYFSQAHCEVYHDDQSISHELRGGLRYHLRVLDSGDIERTISNRSLRFFRYWDYRNGPHFDPVPRGGPLATAHHSLVRLRRISHRDQDIPGCGTGLGFVSILPFETYRDTVERQLFLRSTLGWSAIGEVDYELELVRDVFYGAPICHSTYPGALDADRIRVPAVVRASDSLECRLFIPIFPLFRGKYRELYSNPIKVSYLDLLRTLAARGARKK